jgi:hypothetical protein
VAIPLTYTDSDGPGPYTFEITRSPSEGTLSGEGGSRTYEPGASFSGTDSFEWRVNDGISYSNAATVTIEVADDTDGDALPDWWEAQYGLDPEDVDTDGDGIEDGAEDEDEDNRTNREEFLAGSDPYVSDAAGWAGAGGLSCGTMTAPHPAVAPVGALLLVLLCLRPRARCRA